MFKYLSFQIFQKYLPTIFGGIIFIVQTSSCQKFNSKSDKNNLDNRYTIVEDTVINNHVRSTKFGQFVNSNGFDYKKNFTIESEKFNLNAFSISDSLIKKNKVKSIDQSESFFKFGIVSPEPALKYRITLNQQGKSLEEKIEDQERDWNQKQQIAKILYNYKNDTNIIDIKIFGNKNNQLSEIIYSYDQNRNITSKEKKFIVDVDSNKKVKGGLNDMYQSYSMKKYDFNNNFKEEILNREFFIFRIFENNRIMEEKELFKSGSDQKKKIYQYNLNGDLIRITENEWNHKKNSVEKKRELEFLNNNIIVSNFGLDGETKNYVVYHFNGKYELIEIIETDSKENMTGGFLFSYNSESKLSKIRSLSDSTVKVEFMYDLNNNVTSKKLSNKDSKFDLIYKFNNERFIEYETIYNEQKEQISKRKFTYYSNGLIEEIIDYDVQNKPIKVASFKYEYYD